MKTSGKAILVDKKVILIDDLHEWAKWYETADKDRVIKRTKLKEGEIIISTVFLSIDHSFGNGPSLWFETLVFGGPLDMEMQRYETYDQAVEGHEKMVEKVKAAL